MADKDLNKIIRNLSKVDRRSFDDYLKKFSWVDQNYLRERQEAYDYLTSQGIEHNLANDIIDANATKVTHQQKKKNIPLLAKKYGKFSTGNDWNESQNKAIELFNNSKNKPFGIAYGFRHINDPKDNFHKKDGLVNPFEIKDIEELNDIRNSLKTGKGREDFVFDIYYGN